MADELLRGRQRRYFGYTADITHKIDTPESAKSFRSIISPVTRKIQWKYQPVKSFKPDPPGRPRFADKIIHTAVKTQIPGLLPALKNSPQYEAYDENSIFLRSPDFEQHKERSLHYFWLPAHERDELCGIIHSHVKPSEKRKNKMFVPAGKRTQLTGLAAETAILDQQEYLESIANDPRFSTHKTRAQQRRRMSEVPDRLIRMNRKFQISYWDPTFNKNLSDPFRRARGKLPACDAMCHQQFGYMPEYRDINTCVDEYQRRYDMDQTLAGENIELQDKRDMLRRLSLFGSIEDEERRRGIKHIKQLKDYDRESEALWTKQAKLMIAAAEYINKIKEGRRFPTPPRDLGSAGSSRSRSRSRKRSGKSGTGEGTSSVKSVASTINIEEYIKAELGKGPGHENPHLQKWRKRKHFHHNYNSEDFYMEMYLHFLNPDEDVSVKAPPKELTDVKELRRKMNLDEDHEQDKKLIDLLNEASVEALHVKSSPGRRSRMPSDSLSPEEVEKEKEILEEQLQRLNNPRLTHILTRMMSQISLKSSTITMTSSSGSKKSPGEGEEETTEAPSSQPPGSIFGYGKAPSPPKPGPSTVEDDDDLDKLGDIPEHELKLIMGEIDVDSKGSGSSDNLSSGSSGGEEEEQEGEGEDGGDDDALKLFKKARRKKDSLAEFMDLTTEFRARVCQGEQGKQPGQMNPFAEAVCVLYPEGSDKHHHHKKGDKSKAASSKGTQVPSVQASKH